MPRFLNRFTLLLLFVLFAVTVSTFSSGSAAAKLRRPQYAAANFSSSTDVKLTIESYQGGRILRQVIDQTRTSSESGPVLPVQPAAAGDVVVSQVYSNGGNSGSTYQNNFIELYNRTNSPIDIGGWRFYIANATDSFSTSFSFTSTRGIVINPHSYLLMQLGPDSTNGNPNPFPDLLVPYFSPFPSIPPLNITPSGKIFITPPDTMVFGSTCPLPNPQIVDFVGYGATANCFEGSGPTGTLSNTTAAIRKISGCTDNDKNARDFRIAIPTPRNSFSGANNCLNPIDDADFFVRQHYADFLNRTPDSGGLAFWRNEITSCGSDQQCVELKRINVSAAFFLSIEFQETGYLVYRTYKAAFGNLTTPSGAPVPARFDSFIPDTQQIGQGVIVNAVGWEQKLEDNKVTFFNAFVARTAFSSAYPTSMSPNDFVDAMFAHAGVTPSSTDRSAAINEFGSATNTTDQSARARALRRVAENSTLAQLEKNKAFVLMQYFGYLRRNPYDPPEQTLDYQGYNFWLGKLDQFNGNFVNADMVKAFLISSEYRDRF